MFSYSEIVKKSYRATVEHPLLWLFGLFTVGGFNLNFLYYENIPLRQLVLERSFLEITNYFQQHIAALVVLFLSVLIFSLVGLLLSNWSRVVLILLGFSIIENKPLDLNKQLKNSPTFLWTVIKISLLTVVIILIVGLALFLPTWLLDFDPGFRGILVSAGLIIFVPLVFVISFINIFTTFYAVIYKKSLGGALNLGTDLFVSCWTKILGLVAILTVIYFGAFILGVALITGARLVFELLFLLLVRFNILSFSAIIVMLKWLSNILLWFLLGILSVFFNQALLVLFFELNRPVKHEESAKHPAAFPAAT